MINSSIPFTHSVSPLKVIAKPAATKHSGESAEMLFEDNFSMLFEDGAYMLYEGE